MTKKPSGAQNRKAARQKTGKVDAAWVEASEKIGRPPEDPARRILWAGEHCAQFLYEVASHRKIDARERWKLGAEFVRTLGMIAVKQLYEGRLKRIEATLYGGAAQEEQDGTDGLEPNPTAGRPRKVRARRR